MKIYTKTGDKGQTSLLSGNRVSKHHIRLETYGTVDELNSNIGLLRSYDIDEQSKSFLFDIQNHLFAICSHLALDENLLQITLPQITEAHIKEIEIQIDEMEKHLTPLKNFVLPGGHQAVAVCHVCRTICRRAERRCVQLSNESPIDEILIIFINRLSDYLFVLARFLCNHFDVKEIYWKPNK